MKFYSHNEIYTSWLASMDDIQKYIQRLVPNSDVTDEVLHETFIKVCNSCCSGTEIKNVSAWYKRIAYNTIMDEYKRSARHSDEIEDGFDDTESPFKAADSIIFPLLSLLPEKYAEPLILSDIQSIKQDDIAEQLDLNISATKSRIQRGRVKLRDIVHECCHVETSLNGNIQAIIPKENCKILKDIEPIFFNE